MSKIIGFFLFSVFMIFLTAYLYHSGPYFVRENQVVSLGLIIAVILFNFAGVLYYASPK